MDQTGKRLRLLYTCFSASWGGLEIQALDEAVLMQEKGHTVALACLPHTSLFREGSGKSLHILPLNVSGYLHPHAILTLRQFIQETKIDLVHSQLSKDIATVVPALKLCSRYVPLVLSRRMGSGISKKDLLHRFTYARVSRVLAISSVIRENVAQTTPISSEKIVTVHHGIDLERFSPDRENRSALRRNLGITEDTIVIGFVGRFSRGKGHEEFLNAAAILAPQHPNLQWVVVGKASRGEESYESEIREMARSLELGDRILFTGFRTDIPEIMSVFDVFAFPSHAEAFGAVLVEAMASGLPVVASKSDGVLDIVIEGKTGILVPPKNATALANGLKHLAAHPETRREMGQAGRARAEKFFSRDTLATKLQQVYDDAIREGSLP